MNTGDTPPSWHDQARAVVNQYHDDLLRLVAANLIRPRQRRMTDDLRERILEAIDDPVSIDRTLKSLEPPARRLLAFIDFRDKPRWALQDLVDLLPVVGATEGIGPIRQLLEFGLLFPVIHPNSRLESIETWLSQAATTRLHVFTLPLVAERCRQESLELSAPAGEKIVKAVPTVVDGLEWPLRLMIVWQTVHGNPLRLTQAGGYFKRDLDRLRANPLLSVPLAESPIPISDPAMLAVELARHVGILRCKGDELFTTETPDQWFSHDRSPIDMIWSAFWDIYGWDPLEGLKTDNGHSTKLGSLGIALMAALMTAPAQNWLSCAELAQWTSKVQPDFGRDVKAVEAWCQSLLLGFMHSLGIVEAVKVGDGWRIRLANWFRERAITQPHRASNEATPTLLVQPNLEIVLFRQGLTLSLAGLLTRTAEWKQLGLACTLSLTADSVYRGLETGLTLDEIIRTLERHSTRPLPESVVETMRSWSTKRERVQVYSSAMLLEFRTAEELQIAVKQGLVEQALTDRIGMVSSESQIDYGRFRLVGTRDYMAPEERCVDVGDDGLNLTVQDGKADLLLTAEIRKFADPADSNADDRSLYRMSIESLKRARENGVELRWMDEWFIRRTGSGLPSTAKLLFLAGSIGPLTMNAITVLRLPSPEMADGMERLPAAKPHLLERLGPTTFAVSEQSIVELKRLFANAGLLLDS